nr:hypothetical protein [Tanacetum cinerariifolium]
MLVVPKTVHHCLIKTTMFHGLLVFFSKIKPNGKLTYNSIMNGPYVRRIIPELGDPDRGVSVTETFNDKTDDEHTEKEEIWLRVQQMMKASDIRIQDKKAKFFNECERFTSTNKESIKSYYHRFSKLMNDFKRSKHFPEKIASNLKFLNNYNQNGDDMLPLFTKHKIYMK